MKDFWLGGMTNPTLNTGCTGSMHIAFQQTLDRVKKLGADYVTLYQYAFVIDGSAASPQIDLSNVQLPASELSWIVSAASAAGLKVHLVMQLPGSDESGVPLPQSPSTAWFSASCDQWAQMMQQQAGWSQSAGVDAISLDWNEGWFDFPSYAGAFVPKMKSILAQVRLVYSGKIFLLDRQPFGDVSALADLFPLVDFVRWAPNESPILSAAEDENVTVQLMRSKYDPAVAGLKARYGGTPVEVTAFVQSHRHFLSQGWIEDAPSCSGACMQQSVPIDFSVQAIAYEALLESVAAAQTAPIASVGASMYWYTDTILGQAQFPNLSQSIRNKPAESIVYSWFKR